MTSVKPTPVSLCEQQSVAAAAAAGLRQDGRRPLDFRSPRLCFGAERGACTVRCGRTCVTAAVTCSVTQPRVARPCEGAVHVSVEILAGAESPPRQTASLERLIEQCVRDSDCCDLESLCLQADRLAWRVALHVTVVQWGGCVPSCAVLAAVAVLHQHRRPALRVSGTEILPCPESQPVPLAMLHTPFLFTFALLPSLQDGEFLVLADPSLVEERVMVGALHVAVNSYRELCGIQVSGAVVLRRDQVLRCCSLAVQRVSEVQANLRRALAEDSSARQQGGRPPCIADGLGPILSEFGLSADAVLVEKAEAQEEDTVSCSLPASGNQPDEEDLGCEDAPAVETKIKSERVSDSDSEEEMQSVLKPEVWDTGFV